MKQIVWGDEHWDDWWPGGLLTTDQTTGSHDTDCVGWWALGRLMARRAVDNRSDNRKPWNRLCGVMSTRTIDGQEGCWQQIRQPEAMKQIVWGDEHWDDWWPGGLLTTDQTTGSHETDCVGWWALGRLMARRSVDNRSDNRKPWNRLCGVMSTGTIDGQEGCWQQIRQPEAMKQIVWGDEH